MGEIAKIKAWDYCYQTLCTVQQLVMSDSGEITQLRIAIVSAPHISFWRRTNEVELLYNTGVYDTRGTEVYSKDVIRATIRGKQVIAMVDYADGMYFIGYEAERIPLSDLGAIEIIGSVYEVGSDYLPEMELQGLIRDITGVLVKYGDWVKLYGGDNVKIYPVIRDKEGRLYLGSYDRPLSIDMRLKVLSHDEVAEWFRNNIKQ